MALSYVGTNGVNGATTPGTNYTIDLTALTGGASSSAAAGDLVLVAITLNAGTDDTTFDAVGYHLVTRLFANDSEDTIYSLFYKVMGSTPDTVVNISTPASSTTTSLVYVWRGCDITQPFDVLPTTDTGTNASTINSPSITPVTTGAYVLSGGAAADSSLIAVSSAPTGYSNVAEMSGGTVNARICPVFASKAWTSGAEDPGAWAMTVGGTSDSWVAISIALRPDQGALPAINTNNIAYWKLDESSGNAADATGNGYTLTNNGTTTYASGLINNGADFGSSNSTKYLSGTLVDPDSYNSGFGISFWFKMSTITANMEPFSFQDSSLSGFFVRVVNSTTLSVRMGTGAGDGGTTTLTVPTMTTGTWYHFVMAHNSTSNTYYFNGVEVGGKAGAVTLGGNGTTFNIGRNVAAVNYFQGMVDEFAIFGMVLGQIHATELYNGGAGKQYPFTSQNAGFFSLM